MSGHGLSRRNALKYLGLLTASAAGREFLSAWLPVSNVRADKNLVSISQIHHGQEAEKEAAPNPPQFFNPEEFRCVELLTEMIIPTDDVPGAREARVAEYIDFIVFSAAEFEPSLQKEWADGLTYLNRECQKRFQKTFSETAEQDRVSLLTEMSAPERDASAGHEAFAFFRIAKEMSVEGFYTSKIGLIDVLDYKGMNYQADFPGCTHPEHQQ